jgi:hypothetical protein
MSETTFAGKARGALAIASICAGCTGPFDFSGLRRGSTDSVSTDAGVTDASVTDAGSTCEHHEPQGPPNVTGRGGTLDLVFALYEAAFGNSYDDAGMPGYLNIGFDLDNTCTGEGEGPSCIEPPWATQDHDGPMGIDNSAGRLSFGPGNPTVVFADSATGTLMLRVRDYSGEEDDDQVTVALYVGVGLAPRADGGSAPVWDGNDHWLVHPDMLVPPGDGGTPDVDQPRFVDVHAYVSSGVLVAHWPYALWMSSLPLAPRTLNPVHDVVLSASLVRVGGQRWELHDGVDAVRLVVNEDLPFFARTQTSMTSIEPICQHQDIYETQKQAFCSFVDIAVAPDQPNKACNAISGAATFTALPALIGGVGPGAAPLPDCAPNVHPETDSCGTSSTPYDE